MKRATAAAPKRGAKRVTKRRVAFGILGSTLDSGTAERRWRRWRPSVGLCWQSKLPVDRLELLVGPDSDRLFSVVKADIERVSPATKVVRHDVDFENPWDLEEVYDTLAGVARDYTFDVDREEYLVHISTGTHVAQICLFLLTESGFFPGKLIQTSPLVGARDDPTKAHGTATVIDLDLSRYDRIASRFAEQKHDDVAFLKQGIPTHNPEFNALIDELEKVALASRAPILLTGPTGAGKTQLAKRIYALKHRRGQVDGAFVEVNCATLRGDQTMSTLFGHRKGAFTGAVSDREGLLRKAHGGVLFLDEIGELGADEQAMLLRAIESGTFLPMGSDRESHSKFQLLCGTNRDLGPEVLAGRFREDLLARIELWTFVLPGLAERREDIPANLDFELERYARENDARVSFSKEAKRAYLEFAISPDAVWRGSFRDLASSVTRMSTLAEGGRIREHDVSRECMRLLSSWTGRQSNAIENASNDDVSLLRDYLGAEAVAEIDLFDRPQLAAVIRVCLKSRNASEAGRQLFQASRTKRTSTNDADRIRKYLLKFGLSFDGIVGRV